MDTSKILSIVKFLRTCNAPTSQLIFMSFEDAKNSFIPDDGGIINQQGSFPFHLYKDVDALPAFEGSFSFAHYTFYFINPEKL